jgi:hypothetical protein
VASLRSKRLESPFAPIGPSRWATGQKDAEHWIERESVVGPVEVAVVVRERAVTLLYDRYRGKRRYHQTGFQQVVYIRSGFDAGKT